MREIKFRGWNKKTRRMIDPHKLTPLALNKDCENLPGVFLPFHEDVELMQFTGLLDRNGKEIWEGDICKSYYYEEFEGNCFEIHKVIWDDKSASFRMPCQDGPYLFEDYDLQKVEVIGNIYENKELLKGGKP